MFGMRHRRRATRLTDLSEEARGLDFNPHGELLQLNLAHHIANLPM